MMINFNLLYDKSNRFNKKINILEIACNDGYLLKFFNNYNYLNNFISVRPNYSTSNIAMKKKRQVIQNIFNKNLCKKK